MAIVTSRQQYVSFIYRFFGLFTGLVLVAILLPEAFNAWYNAVWARIVGGALSLTGQSVSVQDTLVSYNGFRVVIIPECTGLIACLLLAAFVLAFPATRKSKIQGLVFGIATLMSFNILRLALLPVIGATLPGAFEYVHIYIAQMLFIVLVFVLCLFWVRYFSDARVQSMGAAFAFKVMGAASLCFVVWMFGNQWYVAGAELVVRMFVHVHRPFSGAMRYGPFFDPKTFNIVTFSTLVLVTTVIPWKKRARTLFIGFAVLSVNYALLRGLELHNAQFHTFWGVRAAIFVNFMGQLFLPIGIWSWMAYAHLFKKKGVYACPICGAEKVGIVEHIVTKHGREALGEPEVREYLEGQGLRS